MSWWDPFIEAFPSLIKAVPLTVMLAVTAVTIGIVIAVFITLARMSGSAFLRWPAYAYVYVIRGTPLFLQLFFIYYGLAQLDIIRHSMLWPLFRDEYWCALLALSLNTSAYGSEIIRGGIQGVAKGQIEAALAFALSPVQRFTRIIFPQALRQMLPAYGNEVVLMIKATSIASTVTIMEVTGTARAIASETYAPVQVFIAAGLIYLALTGSLTYGVHCLEKALHKRGGLAVAR